MKRLTLFLILSVVTRHLVAGKGKASDQQKLAVNSSLHQKKIIVQAQQQPQLQQAVDNEQEDEQTMQDIERIAYALFLNGGPMLCPLF